MVETLNLFRNIYRKFKSTRGKFSRDEVAAAFRFRYSCFKDLLDSNTQMLNIIADLEEKLQGRQVFGMSYVRSQSARAAFHAFRMIKSLDVLSGHKYPVLYGVLDRINARLKEGLGERRELPVTAPVLPLSRVTKEMVDSVGGKNASLGEVLNRVGLPIPAGFAITTRAYQYFLVTNDLVDEINKRKMELDPQDPETVAQVSAAIQQLILAAQVPPDLEDAVLAAYEDLTVATAAASLRVSLRSSAIGEDSDLSFAGQYLTILNVPRARLISAYKEILASLYTPRAISYRLNKGIRDEDTAMSVVCLQMVEAVASGVMYSHHPFNAAANDIIISAVWGLGPYAVDGVITPDAYRVGKAPDLPILEMEVSVKPVQLVANADAGLQEIPVPGRIAGPALPHPGANQDPGGLRDQTGRALPRPPGRGMGPGPGRAPPGLAKPAPAPAGPLRERPGGRAGAGRLSRAGGRGGGGLPRGRLRPGLPGLKRCRPALIP